MKYNDIIMYTTLPKCVRKVYEYRKVTLQRPRSQMRKMTINT